MVEVCIPFIPSFRTDDSAIDKKTNCGTMIPSSNRVDLSRSQGKHILVIERRVSQIIAGLLRESVCIERTKVQVLTP